MSKKSHLGTKTRFEEEAKGNSEMAYWLAKTCKIQLAVISSSK